MFFFVLSAACNNKTGRQQNSQQGSGARSPKVCLPVPGLPKGKRNTQDGTITSAIRNFQHNTHADVATQAHVATRPSRTGMLPPWCPSGKSLRTGGGGARHYFLARISKFPFPRTGTLLPPGMGGVWSLKIVHGAPNFLGEDGFGKSSTRVTNGQIAQAGSQTRTLLNSTGK